MIEFKEKSIGQSLKRIDYIYDLISGNVLHVDYLKEMKDQFSHKYTYDANGNIKTLQRNDGDGVPMDNFTYRYQTLANGYASNTNKLASVQDAVTGNETKKLGDIQPHQSTDNYVYDGIGNLIQDEQEEIALIQWRANGKVKSVTRTTNSIKPDLAFYYDAMGQRSIKLEKPKSTDGSLLGEQHWKYTYYVRDAQGNVMAVYDKKYEEIGANTYREILSVSEHNIYGSSRLGLQKPIDDKLADRKFIASLNPTTQQFTNVNTTNVTVLQVNKLNLAYYKGEKAYELSNHLGNVLAVVSDRLFYESTDGITVSGVQADLLSASDYYPFGMQMPNRTITTDKYRYGFNGKELDSEGMGGGGSTYDYGFRIYNPQIAKFLSVDPLFNSFAYYTPYQYAGNKPIAASDLDGLEEKIEVYFEDKNGDIT